MRMGGKMRANVTVFIYILFTHSPLDRCGASFCSIFIVKISFAPSLSPSALPFQRLWHNNHHAYDWFCMRFYEHQYLGTIFIPFARPFSLSWFRHSLHKRKLHTQIIPPLQCSVGYLCFFGSLSELSAAYPLQMSPRCASKKKSTADGDRREEGNNAIQNTANPDSTTEKMTHSFVRSLLFFVHFERIIKAIKMSEKQQTHISYFVDGKKVIQMQLGRIYFASRTLNSLFRGNPLQIRGQQESEIFAANISISICIASAPTLGFAARFPFHWQQFLWFHFTFSP